MSLFTKKFKQLTSIIMIFLSLVALTANSVKLANLCLTIAVIMTILQKGEDKNV